MHCLKEEHLLDTCGYCRTDVSQIKWESEFYLDIHYKTMTCPECNKKQSVKVSYEGSGHDNWNLEKRLG